VWNPVQWRSGWSGERCGGWPGVRDLGSIIIRSSRGMPRCRKHAALPERIQRCHLPECRHPICSRIRRQPSFSYCDQERSSTRSWYWNYFHASVICHDDYPFLNYAPPDRCAGPTGHLRFSGFRSFDPAFWIGERSRCDVENYTTDFLVMPPAYKSTIRIRTSSSCPAPRHCSRVIPRIIIFSVHLSHEAIPTSRALSSLAALCISVITWKERQRQKQLSVPPKTSIIPDNVLFFRTNEPCLQVCSLTIVPKCIH
jgi:hypothetical protein